MKHTKDVLEEVLNERTRQIALGYNTGHDDQMGAEHLVDELLDRTDGIVDTTDEELVQATGPRRDLIQIAALAVAAVERIDRAQAKAAND